MASFAAIIPHYNDSRRIGAALASLLGQARAFDDILIVDDGSTDDSVAVIERLIAGHSHVRLVRNERNMGVVATLNRAVRMLDADYVHMASANDTYHPRLLEYCARALAEHPDIALFCGNAEFRYEKTRRTMRMGLPQHPHYIPAESFSAIVRRNPLTFFGGGIVMRRNAVLDAGGLREPLRWHSDWALYYLLAFRYGFYFIPETLVAIDMSSGSYSSQARIWRRQREVIYALLTLLPRDYPQLQAQWRAAALLPLYSLRACAFLWRPECRWYVSPMLCWRLLFYNTAYRLKHLLPRAFVLKLRPLLRV